MARTKSAGPAIDSKLRAVDILMAQGRSFAHALDEIAATASDYLAWRAAYLGQRPEQIRQLYGVDADRASAVDPTEFIGRYMPGTCPICGSSQGFEDFTENLRETGRCLNCNSNNRHRQMALVTRLALGLFPEGPLVLPAGLAVHNTESTGALDQRLRDQAGYTFSEYWGPNSAPGEIVDGVRNEDMQRLSFANESLDLFLSSDVLEHMPHPYRAHEEVFRVLKPGGRHVFTAPFHGLYDDDVRAKIEDGEIVYSDEKLFHGDPIRPDEGVLVWTIFGAEMLDRLRKIGFQALM